MGNKKVIDNYDVVKSLLEADPALRDNETLTWLKVKNNYLRSKGINPKTVSSYAVDLMDLRGELPLRKSVERAWRLVLFNCPNLRGAGYAKRHKKEVEVIKDILVLQ